MAKPELPPELPNGVPEARRLVWVVRGLAVAWGVLLAVLVVAVPRLVRAYADFGLDLPRLTVGVIRVSQAAARSPLIAAVDLIGLIAIQWWLLAALARAKPPHVWRSVAAALLALPVLGLLLVIVAVGLPLLTLLTRLAG